jgi:hypothetical protein
MNSAIGTQGVAAGGAQNIAGGLWTTVLGGQANEALGDVAVVIGGTSSSARGMQSVVLGGLGAATVGDSSATVGGFKSVSSGTLSVALGGAFAKSDANFSVAIGAGAETDAEDTGAVVISAYAPHVSDAGQVTPSQTCSSGGAGTVTICAADTITLNSKQLIINHVDVIADLQNLFARVTALETALKGSRRLL